jgi:hypothetical protein
MVVDVGPKKAPWTSAAMQDDNTRSGHGLPAARKIAFTDILHTNIFIHKATSMNTLVEVMA